MERQKRQVDSRKQIHSARMDSNWMVIELTGLNSSERMIVINVVEQKRLTQRYWKRCNASCARKHASLNFKLLSIVRCCISEKRVETREEENEFLRMDN